MPAPDRAHRRVPVQHPGLKHGPQNGKFHEIIQENLTRTAFLATRWIDTPTWHTCVPLARNRVGGQGQGQGERGWWLLSLLCGCGRGALQRTLSSVSKCSRRASEHVTATQSASAGERAKHV